MLRRLGRTRYELIAIGLGAMPLTLRGCPDEASAHRVIRCFLDGGGNFIDTANVYTEDPDRVGENERLIAAALAEVDNTDQVMIATKGGLRRTQTGWEVDGSPHWLRQSCAASLKALATDCIDLYQLHVPDPDIDIRESIGALRDLQDAGKIRHVGLCNVGVEQIEAAREIADIVSVQNALNPRRKKTLRFGVVDYCREAGITFIAHSPVGGYHHYRQLHEDGELSAIARRYETTTACLSLAWLLHLGALPIPGARRCESVQASLSSMTLSLAAEDIEAINELPDW